MRLAETMTFWTAVVLYAGSFALFAVASIYKAGASRPRQAVWACRLAFTLHTASLALRWFETGHPPYVAFFESVSAAAWFAASAYLIVQTVRPRLRLSGIVVTGAIFLLLGWASTPSYAGEALTAGLQSIWLFIHATFATAAVGCFLVAAGVSALWLKKRRDNGKTAPKNGVLSPESIDEVAHRLITIGFLFYTVMLLSGAVWANEAWGSYWSWDPIETWSLITWLLYAVYLHLHFTFRRLNGAFTVWYAILAVVAAAFSLWGVGYVYSTIHHYG